MYRRDLRQQQQQKQEMESKTGLKTLDRIVEIPMVNSAIDFYRDVKEKNVIFRTSLNLAELSVKTMSFAATPIKSICQKPIDSVDTYMYDKINDFESTFPSIGKPTEQIKDSAIQQAKIIINKTVLEPIDNIKEKTTDLSLNILDTCLENKLARLLTNPILSFTEKSLDYLLPHPEIARPDSSENKTIKRLYDINSRLYQLTFLQLQRLHYRFENSINKLKILKDFSMLLASDARERALTTIASAKSNTLVSQCATFINQNKISVQNWQKLCTSYLTAIFSDVTQMIEKYMSLVKTFPIVFNGSKIKQNIEDLTNQLNKEKFTSYLNLSIEQLSSIHTALLSYTNQMFQVIYDFKFAQLFNSKQGESKSESNQQHQLQQQQQPKHNKKQ